MATITEHVHSKFARAFAFQLQIEAPVVQEPKANLTLIDLTLDEVRPDRVLVEMKYSEVCHTMRIIFHPSTLSASLCSGYRSITRPPAVGDVSAIFAHEGAGVFRAIRFRRDE